jgi:hypothetical protein
MATDDRIRDRGAPDIFLEESEHSQDETLVDGILAAQDAKNDSDDQQDATAKLSGFPALGRLLHRLNGERLTPAAWALEAQAAS